MDLGQHTHFWGERRKERQGTCSEKVPVEVDAKGWRGTQRSLLETEKVQGGCLGNAGQWLGGQRDRKRDTFGEGSNRTAGEC